ncbi:MAG: pilus assembly protein TadG-related protein [Gemmatimonadaceae bacterium]
MERLRNRKGAVAVVVAILMLAFLMIAAVAVDMSRLYALRTQMTTIADAASLAGAVELLKNPSDEGAADLRAREYASFNRISSGDSIEVMLGRWVTDGGGGGTFETGPPPAGPDYKDAVQVRTFFRPESYLIARSFDSSTVRLNRRAIGWVGGSVVETNCMKPWAIPYVDLVERINAYRGITGPTRDLTREDIATLLEMPEAVRTFVLDQTVGSAFEFDSVGRFGAIALPGTVRGGGIFEFLDNLMRGSDRYAENIANTTCDETNQLAIGDWIAEVTPDAQIVEHTKTLAPGLIGDTVKIVLWEDAPLPSLPIYCGSDRCKRIKMLGMMRLDAVIDTMAGQVSVHGVLLSAPSSGKIGSTVTPLRYDRPMLVH